MKSLIRNLRIIFILLAIAALTGCGDSTSSGNSISGTASKGPIDGGSVEVYALLADGTKGDLLGTATTSADGSFTIGVGNYSGAALVEVSGGTYIDEATGLLVDNILMRAAIPDVSHTISVAVTPLTELAVAYAEGSGGLTAENIAVSNTYVSELFGGVDIIGTEPVDVLSAPKNNATQDQIDYGLMLATISQMVSNDAVITDVTQLMTMMATDLLADGTLDETAGGLITALTDFLGSPNNATPVTTLAGMTIDDVVAGQVVVDLWTWISGSDTANQTGVYNDIDPAKNVPGARQGAVGWKDASGTMWLFGGQVPVTYNYMNDLWKYDGTNWTWVSGSDAGDQPPIYNDLDPANNDPGSRNYPISWTDSNNNLWLFGGAVSQTGILNDLWKFDGTNWTWVSGSNIGQQKGVYGTMGIVAPSNVPGGRYNSVSWTDSNDNLWLFGGGGYDSVVVGGFTTQLNDLWKFDGSNWIWVSGSNIGNQPGTYNDADPANNVPGGRSYVVSWIDSSDNLWLFGGYGFDSTGSYYYLNDLWKFDGNNWILVSGSDIISQPGIYGTKGTANPLNVPGARAGSVSWKDSNDNLWLFGGWGFDSGGAETTFNDLWKFDGTNWTWVSGSDTGAGAAVGTYSDALQANNSPGGRGDSVSWISNNGNPIIFGGWGFDSAGVEGHLNDLWRYEP